MAFENNQQDAFNLRNDTESLKLWQSELDKATTSIGAAEVAAEEELAVLKYKNLNAQQKQRTEQLDKLIALEDEGIRELARSRLTLSSRQFELRKKEIQKEFQLAKEAAEELLKIQNKKAKAAPKKQTSVTEDLTVSPKQKRTDTAKKEPKKVILDQGIKKLADASSLTSEVIGLLGSIDETVGSLLEVTTGAAAQKEIAVPPELLKTAGTNTANVADTGAVKMNEVAARILSLPAEISTAIEAVTKANAIQKASSEDTSKAREAGPVKKLIDALKVSTNALLPKTEQADVTNRTSVDIEITPADTAKLTPETASILSSIDGTLKSLLDITKNSVISNTSSKPQEPVKTDTIKTELIEKAVASGHELLTNAVNDLLDTVNTGFTNVFSVAEERIADIKTSQNADANDKTAENIKSAGKQTQADTKATENKKADSNGGTNGGQSASAKTSDKEKEIQFTNDASLLEALDLGHFSSEAVFRAFDELRSSIDASARVTLDRVKNTESPQSTIDLAGEFLKDTKSANAAARKLQKFNENKALNMRLTQLAAEQRIRAEHENIAYANITEKASAFAKKQDVLQNGAKYFEEASQKLKTAHINKETELRLAGISAEAKAKDLINSREQYILEARLARENAFYEKQNKLAEDRINLETEIAWEREHIEEVMAQELQEKRLGYLQDYQKLQLEAGKYTVDQAKYEKDRARKDNKAAKKEAVNGITDGLKKFGTGEFSLTDVQQSYGKYMGQRTAELKEAGMNDASAELTANFELLAEAAGGLAATLDAKVKEISSMQGFVDTRLQGSRVNDRDFGNGSYWNELLEDMKKIAGASPFIKQEKLVDNVKTLVDKGISFDIKQRAFLMTIQEKIANTFNVADGTLLRLIRIQQQDTTAGRLGMESALNSFLNSMYETSEYLESVAASVRGSLEEMQALMEGTAATELEFQVQKWMGSLYSVGMSQEAVQNIARTFGQIASGDVSGLTGSGTGNLLIMAANEAGKSIADILQKGLDADETNELMQAMVNYLAEIAETSSDSRVVQQQLANVYGIKASDLKAATNLSTSLKDVAKQDLSYSGMMGQLNQMMNTIRFRTSIGEGMTNMWDNMMYSMASTQASNPILYALPKMADLLRDVTGGDGIALPFLNVMGFGVDLNTSVADLMSVASMAGTALGSLGAVITGLSDLANPLVGSTMLLRAGINPLGKAPVLARGKATPLQNLRGASISESGFIGNASGSDIKSQTLQGAEDDKKKLMVEAKDEESADDVATRANLAVVNIYNLLEEVAHGSQSLRVKIVNSNAISCSGAINNGGGSNNVIGEGSGNGVTGAYGNNSLVNGVNGGADNGNWILAM